MTNKKIIRTVGKDMETLNSYIWLVKNSMAVPAKIKQLLAYEPELLLLGRGGKQQKLAQVPGLCHLSGRLKWSSWLQPSSVLTITAI